MPTYSGIALAVSLGSSVGLIIAQTIPSGEPSVGGAGWVGAGLLGAVLSWLLFIHLPSKDKQITAFNDAKDRHVETMTKEFREELKESRIEVRIIREEVKSIRDEFRGALDAILKHCAQEAGNVADAIRAEFQALREERNSHGR